MNRLLVFALLILPIGAISQPIIRNSVTTNSPSVMTNVVKGMASNVVSTASVSASITTNNGTLSSSVLVGNGARGATNTGVGAVPINGNGTATTGSQILSIASNIATNNGNNSFSSDQSFVGIITSKGQIVVTNGNNNAIVLFTNSAVANGPSIFVTSSGFIVATNPAAANQGVSWRTNGLWYVNQVDALNSYLIGTLTVLDGGASLRVGLGSTTINLSKATTVSSTLAVTGAATFNAVTSTNGYTMASNSLSVWPATPVRPSDAYWGNSNGTIYLLQSTSAGGTWATTNKIGQ